MRLNHDKQNLVLLKESWELLLQSILTLELSVEKVRSFGVKDDYTFEELEAFDSLTSKFSRSSDIYTQKVLRTIWALLHEPFVPFIDMMNKAEKMQVLRTADQIVIIRDLRNQIAHEYIPEAFQELAGDVIKYSKVLEENIDTTRLFLEDRRWI